MEAISNLNIRPKKHASYIGYFKEGHFVQYQLQVYGQIIRGPRQEYKLFDTLPVTSVFDTPLVPLLGAKKTLCD